MMIRFLSSRCLFGVTSALPPDIPNDLWCDDEPISLMIDLNNIEQLIEILEAEVGAVGSRAKGVTPQHLSKVWSIDIETAKRTIDVTTRLRKHENSGHLSRQYSTNDMMLRYKRIKSHFFMDTFQVTKTAISQRQNWYMQLFVSDTGFMYVVPMKSKTNIV